MTEQSQKIELVEFLSEYGMSSSGGLTLNSDALKELGWIPGLTSCEQLIDIENKRALLIKSTIRQALPPLLGNLPENEIFSLKSVFRTWPINKVKLVIIDRRIRKDLCWQPKTKLIQVLDRRVPGIWIEAVKQ